MLVRMIEKKRERYDELEEEEFRAANTDPASTPEAQHLNCVLRGHRRLCDH